MIDGALKLQAQRTSHTQSYQDPNECEMRLTPLSSPRITSSAAIVQIGFDQNAMSDLTMEPLTIHQTSRWQRCSAVLFNDRSVGRIDAAVGVHIRTEIRSIDGLTETCLCLRNIRGINRGVGVRVTDQDAHRNREVGRRCIGGGCVVY